MIKIRKDRNGFTLIEMILAMSLFSLIAVSVYGVFFNGMKLGSKSSSNNEIYLEMRLALGGLANDLGNCVPFEMPKAYQDFSSFDGKADRLTFIWPSDSGLKVISYYLEEDEQVKIVTTRLGKVYKKNVAITAGDVSNSARMRNLIREEISLPEFLSGKQSDNKDVQIVASHVREGGLRFSYGFKEGEDQNSIQWKSEWRKNIVPMAVRIEIDFISGDGDALSFQIKRDVLIAHGALGKEEKT